MSRQTVVSEHRVSSSSLRGYVTGFLLSLLLSLAAYLAAVMQVFEGNTLAAGIGLLAVLQFGVQLRYFLHIRDERRPRLNAWALGFMLLIVVILVAGSLWIMTNLDYRHMSSPAGDPDHLNQEIIEDEGIRR